VQSGVATMTRVCSYTRASRFEGPQPRTSAVIVQELRTLLQKAGIAGPYVLVGHSFGGLTVRLYASQYPDEVIGMVLVDASHEDQRQRFPPLEEPQMVEEDRAFRSGQNPEGVDVDASAAQIRHARAERPVLDRPLVVVTAGRYQFPPEVPETVREQIKQVHRELQVDLVRLSPEGKQVIAEKSYHHDISTNEPRLVIDAIREVVEAARRR
jgi:pimeloyl-ACP methyl ester carboxylesterase